MLRRWSLVAREDVQSVGAVRCKQGGQQRDQRQGDDDEGAGGRHRIDTPDGATDAGRGQRTWPGELGDLVDLSHCRSPSGEGRGPRSGCLLYTSDAADEEDSVDL